MPVLCTTAKPMQEPRAFRLRTPRNDLMLLICTVCPRVVVRLERTSLSMGVPLNAADKVNSGLTCIQLQLRPTWRFRKHWRARTSRRQVGIPSVTPSNFRALLVADRLSARDDSVHEMIDPSLTPPRWPSAGPSGGPQVAPTRDGQWPGNLAALLPHRDPLRSHTAPAAPHPSGRRPAVQVRPIVGSTGKWRPKRRSPRFHCGNAKAKATRSSP